MSDNNAEGISFLEVTGASEHFLKDISCKIPHDRLTMISGVSGSGKSSLVFDTIHKEGLRRFLETLSIHARGFVGKMGGPSCRGFSGLRPTLAIAQRGPQPQSRSTVGTLTDIHDFLRILFARLGTPHCPYCRLQYKASSDSEIAKRIRTVCGDSPLAVLFPAIEGHRGAFRRELEELRKRGVQKVRVDGVFLPLDPAPQLCREELHNVEGVVAESVSPLAPDFPELVSLALRSGQGTLLTLAPDGKASRFTLALSCPGCGSSPPEIGPRLFSFNSPYGACPACQGLGVQDAIDPSLLVGDARKTVREGALVLTTPKGYIIYSQVTMDVLDEVCQIHGFTVDIPWENLTDEQRRVILFGSDRIRIPFGKHPLESRLKWSGITARPREEDYYKGIIPTMEAILKRDRNPNILRFVRSAPCSACGGLRLNPHARAVLFNGVSITGLSRKQVSDLSSWCREVRPGERERAVVASVLEAVVPRLERLERLGLGHLSLDRSSTSLSAGEWQKIRLALLAFTDLSGLLYILDEPSLGLHPRDQERLLELLRNLRDRGNTLVAVEHRAQALLQADWLIDLGPGAGPAGGNLLFQGRPRDLLSSASQTPTGRWLARKDLPSQVSGGRQARSPSSNEVLEVLGARENNLKDIDVSFPLGRFCAVTGVSGAGKSTLVNKVLYSNLRFRLHGSTEPRGKCREIRGIELVDKVILVDQEPIGRTPRSNPSTYTGLFDHVRDLFAAQPLSRERGWSKSRFSWNLPGGRCEACQGSGIQEIGLHLLDPVGVRCEECEGRRYLPETLDVTFRDLSIAQVLDLSVSSALEVFQGQPRIMRILRAMIEVGLGYLTLGQPATTLSGGEAQRMKLATELAKPGTGKTLYILDEPASGLHHDDVLLLVGILKRLTSAGNTVIAVEHHPEFLLSADWLVDLGPESGDKGGTVVGKGSPTELMANTASHTGRAMRNWASPGGDPVTPAPRSSGTLRKEIRLFEVKTHNLKDVTVAFPKGKLTVVTGVSGSGKSSLVCDTLLAESHRRYVESLSSYARRFVDRFERPTISRVEGLTPAVGILGARGKPNARSTVGTVSGCLDLLRLLMSRAGTRFCPKCGLSLDGKICPGCGFQGVPVLTAGMFSFNQVQGSCPDCHGLGTITRCDPENLITDPEKPLPAGAMDGTSVGRFYGEPEGQFMAILLSAGRELGMDFSKPWCELSPEERRVACFGCGARVFHVTWSFRRGKRIGKHEMDSPWPGLVALVEEEYGRKRGDERGENFASLMREATCSGCLGSRLKPEFRMVRWNGFSISDLCGESVRSLVARIETYSRPEGVGEGTKPSSEVSLPILSALSERLHHLLEGGLGYLSLDRPVATLSGGEFRRLLLVANLGGELSGITYVLDEPTIGLHPSDTARLLALLRRLRDRGNTLVVVEHDPAVIQAADHVVEMGPGPGPDGGSVVVAGSWAEIKDQSAFLTGKWIDPSAPWPDTPSPDLTFPGLQFRGICRNNLTDLDLDIPLGGVVVLTGVSGSGKSTLVEDVVRPSLSTRRPVGCREFSGGEGLGGVVMVDQELPAGKASSLVATCAGILGPIGSLLAGTQTAKKLGLLESAFSPFSSRGRCESCQGLGFERLDLDFLAGVRLLCEECGGKRFKPEILSCRFGDRAISDILDLTVAEASVFFDRSPAVMHHLEPLLKVGLGHLPLGRATDSLSVGERQRLKLALGLRGSGEPGTPGPRLLFLFDEPTTGLHLSDVAALLPIFWELVNAGHSLLVVEHHLEVIRRADWIIDLGPGAGELGGRVVVAGPPHVVAAHRGSPTGAALSVRPTRMKMV